MEPTHHHHLKLLSLVLLVLQSSAHALLIRYSRTIGATNYIPSTTVVTVELLKFVVSGAFVLYEYRERANRGILVLQLLAHSFHAMVPAFLYAIQNNLVFVALSNLDAATFQVMYQTKIVTTALFSVILLGRQLTYAQWISLLLLFEGVVMVQLPQQQQPECPPLQDAAAATTTPIIAEEDLHRDTLLGFVVVIAISLTSGFAGVYFEKILKSSKSMSLFARNLQLSLWGFMFSMIGMLLADSTPLSEQGFFGGYNGSVWGIIFISAYGGLLIAVVVKYTDNIAKGYATSISIILSSVVSFFYFHFDVTLIFVLGTTIVIASVILYSEPDKGWQSRAAALADLPTTLAGTKRPNLNQ